MISSAFGSLEKLKMSSPATSIILLIVQVDILNSSDSSLSSVIILFNIFLLISQVSVYGFIVFDSYRLSFHVPVSIRHVSNGHLGITLSTTTSPSEFLFTSISSVSIPMIETPVLSSLL